MDRNYAGEFGANEVAKCLIPQLPSAINHGTKLHSTNARVIESRYIIKTQIAFNEGLDENEFDAIDQYMELVIQFGHVIMFSSVFPLASCAVLLSNFISFLSIKNDFRFKRRLVPDVSLGIGEFSYYLDVLSHASIIINCAIIYFTSTTYREKFVNSDSELINVCLGVGSTSCQ